VSSFDAVVVGAGHNGLVAACYLARAGRRVLVAEAGPEPGGGARSTATIPDHRFDLHSVAHNIVNMTSIPEELDLVGAGLEYLEMDPFSMATFADGRAVRFHRSVDATVSSIAEHDRAEADDYRRFVAAGDHLLDAVLPTVRQRRRLRDLPAAGAGALRYLAPSPLERIRDLLSPYGTLLRRRLRSDLTRGPVAAFAAHGAVGPEAVGGGTFALWQAAYHRFGQWHARGGAGALSDALVRRAEQLGVEVRVGSPVEAIEHRDGRVVAVHGGGGRVTTDVVITALDPVRALLDLPDPPLDDALRRDVSAIRRGPVVQAVLHVATTDLPRYPDGRPGDGNGLQSYVDRLDDLVLGWRRAAAGSLPDPLPLYAFTPSAIDPTVAPPGRHTVYLACPAAPSRPEGGWDAHRDAFVDAALTTVDERAPGFRSSVVDVAVRTPDVMEAERWPGGHPMHVDIALDQLGPLRPTPALARHRTPVRGLYVSGAGTAPMGGVAGTPGRAAARRVLADGRRRR
jgi:phytoene dehydrogenase-like protein